MAVFVVDCPTCRARVAADEAAVAERTGFDHDAGEPWGERIVVGACPKCRQLIAGRSTQTGFENFDSEEDTWSDVIRIYPQPKRTFSSYRIPRVVTFSLEEGDRSLQAGAFTAASAMFGRALEAVCRHILDSKGIAGAQKIMLAKGISKLYELRVIDDRLHDWSKALHAGRNFASHPEEGEIAREDAEDLQSFVIAIIEYVYDLADKYEQFKKRETRRAERKRRLLPPNNLPEM